MKHSTTVAVIVSTAALLSAACVGASAQVLSNEAEPRLTVYYKIPLGSHGRAAQGPVLGLALERTERVDASPTSRSGAHPSADLAISVRSGVTELRLNGEKVDFRRRMLDKEEEKSSEPPVEWGVIILVGAAIAGAVALANKGKDNFEECLDVSGC